MARAFAPQPTAAIDRALSRVLAEIHDGLRHGFFEFTLTCEIVNQERRRFTLRAGKSHQFVIPKEECERPLEQQQSTPATGAARPHLLAATDRHDGDDGLRSA
jgi:hypothetical protein